MGREKVHLTPLLEQTTKPWKVKACWHIEASMSRNTGKPASIEPQSLQLQNEL